jgi:hypothetical protein
MHISVSGSTTDYLCRIYNVIDQSLVCHGIYMHIFATEVDLLKNIILFEKFCHFTRNLIVKSARRWGISEDIGMITLNIYIWFYSVLYVTTK